MRLQAQRPGTQAFIPQPQLSEVEAAPGADTAFSAMVARYRRAPVPVASYGVAVQTAHVGPTAEEQAAHRQAGTPPLVLLHGFDSSSLEMRRLHPLLAPHAETWAVDQLGWGFNDHAHFAANPQLRLTPQQRREHLHAFWEAHIGRPAVVVGASLGGAAAMDWALHHPEAVSKLVLIDSAGWTEPGNGDAPRALAALGVWVLRTEPLRQRANVMAYADQAYATRAAMLTGRLHTHMPGWSDSNIAFIRGGGYRIADDIPKVQQPALVVWGRQDQIIPPKDAQRFADALPNNELLYLDDCGHCGHLEQPEAVAKAVLRWAGVRGGSGAGGSAGAPPPPAQAAAAAV